MASRHAALAALLAAAAVMPVSVQATVLPQPREAAVGACVSPLKTYEVRFEGVARERGALEILDERWRALGLTARTPADVAVRVSSLSESDRASRAKLGDEGYILRVSRGQAHVEADTAAGRFYGLMTLAQLPRPDGAGWCLPQARIVDEPAMRWRGVSDDVSRGPIPTMDFFEERIRTIAAFKGNLYSLYFESAFRDPSVPLSSPPDALTPRELARLAAYAARFHVALMPEQETLGHMHRLLSLERFSDLAELPHDYVLAPAVPAAERLVQRIVKDEAAEVKGRTPFFHVGGDEPNLVGTGRSAGLREREGSEAMYLGYYAPLFATVTSMGMRPVIWGDVLLAHPDAVAALPKSVVVANWHYAAEPSYEKYLTPFANAGIEQMVAPGADDWGQIYADLSTATANAATFVRDGQATPKVIGMLETVWHDDGESLFANTWYPVLFALSAAWQPAPIDERAFHARFDWAFFGTGDQRLANDLDSLRAAQDDLRTTPTDPSNYLFWIDPFRNQRRIFAQIEVTKLRLDAERALHDLETQSAPPPLHADALPAMRLAAERYDFLGRKYQIAREFDAYYADALAHAGKDDERVFHDLFLARYLLWEWRDNLSVVRDDYARAWERECRPAYLSNVLARYDEWRSNVLRMEDRLQGVTRERYYREDHRLPTRAELFSGLDVGNEAP
ncbi:hypothetical protein EPN44_13885 [bacterium]|nr:MAG: hypothetical protein EPN44_13885 [bacterium]